MRAAVVSERAMALFEKRDPLEDLSGSLVRLKRGLWNRLARIAKAEATNAGRYVSRNDVIETVLEKFAADYERENAKLLERIPMEGGEPEQAPSSKPKKGGK